jgi:hypothetical protein
MKIAYFSAEGLMLLPALSPPQRHMCWHARRDSVGRSETRPVDVLGRSALPEYKKMSFTVRGPHQKVRMREDTYNAASTLPVDPSR